MLLELLHPLRRVVLDVAALPAVILLERDVEDWNMIPAQQRLQLLDGPGCLGALRWVCLPDRVAKDHLARLAIGAQDGAKPGRRAIGTRQFRPGILIATDQYFTVATNSSSVPLRRRKQKIG